MKDHLILNDGDNVAVALARLARGTVVEPGGIVLADDVPAGHKFALADIPAGTGVVKYGAPIGHAVRDIRAGEWVHVHNLGTNLDGEVEYRYEPVDSPRKTGAPIPAFLGYRRANGGAGVRNEAWVIPTVGCVNRLAERLAAGMNRALPDGVGPAVAFPHPHGCSQLGGDHENTRLILANLAAHPNAGAVLFVGLGCENNAVAPFRELVESRPGRNPNIGYLVAQDEGDEYAAGMALLEKLAAGAAGAAREPIPISELRVGLKCGGSDGLSGITANPLLGLFSDWLVDRGGSTILTEVPEMFGAERDLLNRAADRDVFERGAAMINGFKRYFLRHGQTVYENPSPGNKDGGITTLEEKSLGCTRKAGRRAVVDVLPYGGLVSKRGVNLVAGPGNDIVAATLLAAAGAQLVLFTTGRGTPLGGPVPVVKVSTNTPLAARKPGWIDFDAGPLASGESRESALERFVALVLEVASGKPARAEEPGSRDFAIFKDGVTL